MNRSAGDRSTNPLSRYAIGVQRRIALLIGAPFSATISARTGEANDLFGCVSSGAVRCAVRSLRSRSCLLRVYPPMKTRRHAALAPRPKRALLDLVSTSRAYQQRLERSERHLAALAAFSRAVVSADGDEEVLAALTAASVPASASWAIAVFARKPGTAPVASIQAADPDIARRLADDLANPASDLSRLLVDVREWQQGVPVTDLKATEELCEDIVSSNLAAPLIIDGIVLGAFVVGAEDEAPHFDQSDCRFVHDLARRASTTISWIRRRNVTRKELRDHRRIEEALRESEMRFRTLANAGPVLIRQDDEQGNADYFNHPWLDFTGRTIREQIGERWLESVHPNDVAVVKASMESIRIEHESITIEYRMRRFDGDYCWMTDRGVPRFSVDGVYLGYIWSALDISDQKRAETGLRLLAATGIVVTSSLDLREMLERFALLVTESFANVCVIELGDGGDLTRIASVASRQDESEETRTATHTVIRYLSERMAFSSPELPDDPAGRQVLHLVTSRVEDARLRGQLMRADITSLIVDRMDARGRTSGVIAIATRTASGRVFDEQDRVLARSLAHRVAVVVDNAQLFADAQIAEERYRRLFEGSADAIVAFDRALLIHDANLALTHLVRRQSRGIVDRSLETLIVSQSEPWDRIFLALLDGEWRGELTLLRGDGTHVPVEAWITRTLLSEGAVFIAAMRDVSERASLEATRSQLLASVSHDLKNPINSIKANAQLALRQLRRGKAIDQVKIEETFDRIDGLTNRMVLQIEGLMDVALLEAGAKLELELRDVDLGALARLIVDQYQATTNIHQLIVTSPPEPVIGFWDVHRLERVLTNLLTNAIKYSPEGGEIELAITKATDSAGRPWAVLSITDDGIGVPAADMPHLFSRFGRGANVTTRISGTGIGLVGVSQIIAQHGGTIPVESVEGGGSTFTIPLPLPASRDGDQA